MIEVSELPLGMVQAADIQPHPAQVSYAGRQEAALAGLVIGEAPPTAEAAQPGETMRRGVGDKALRLAQACRNLPLALFVKASNAGVAGRLVEAAVTQRALPARLAMSLGVTAAQATLGIVSYRLFGHDAVSPLLTHNTGYGGGVLIDHATLTAYTQPAHRVDLQAEAHAALTHPEMLRHQGHDTVSQDFASLSHGWETMIKEAHAGEKAGVVQVVYPEKGNPNYFWYKVLVPDGHGDRTWVSDSASVDKVFAQHSGGKQIFVPEGTKTPDITAHHTGAGGHHHSSGGETGQGSGHQSGSAHATGPASPVATGPEHGHVGNQSGFIDQKIALFKQDWHEIEAYFGHRLQHQKPLRIDLTYIEALSAVVTAWTAFTLWLTARDGKRTQKKRQDNWSGKRLPRHVRRPRSSFSLGAGHIAPGLFQGRSGKQYSFADLDSVRSDISGDEPVVVFQRRRRHRDGYLNIFDPDTWLFAKEGDNSAELMVGPNGEVPSDILRALGPRTVKKGQDWTEVKNKNRRQRRSSRRRSPRRGRISGPST